MLLKVKAGEVKVGDVIRGAGKVERIVPADHGERWIRFYVAGKNEAVEWLPFENVPLERAGILTIGDVMAEVESNVNRPEIARAEEDAAVLGELIERAVANADALAERARSYARDAEKAEGDERLAYMADAGRAVRAARRVYRLVRSESVRHTDVTLAILKRLIEE